PDCELLPQRASKGLHESEDVRDDLSEERVFIAVVVVDRALRQAGQLRDLLHCRARVALVEEQLPCGIEDRRARPDDTGVISTRSGGTPYTLSPSGAGPIIYCTHEYIIILLRLKVHERGQCMQHSTAAPAPSTDDPNYPPASRFLLACGIVAGPLYLAVGI